MNHYVGAQRLQKVRANLFGGFFGGFCKVNLRRGLPHRRSSRGHNWRSAKAQKIFPPQNLRHCLSFSFTLTLIHCNTVMHKQVAKKLATYLSANVQLQQRRDKEAPPIAPLFQLIAITTNSECSQSPGSEAPCASTQAPLQQGRHPHLSKLFWQTRPSTTVFPLKRSSMLRHIVAPHTSEERRGRRRILRSRQCSWAGASLARSVSESERAAQTASSE